MAIDPLTALLDLGKIAAEKIWPDANKRAEQLERLEKLKQDGDLVRMQSEVSLLLAQVDLNKTEAQHPSVFVAGWRPAIGWVCAMSLFTYYVPYCLAATGMWVYQCVNAGSLVERPDLNIADLVGLVAAMLGVGLPRTYEKVKEVATSRTQK
jgi:hypothetical protein